MLHDRLHERAVVENVCVKVTIGVGFCLLPFPLRP
jgi:hypothetical protein